MIEARPIATDELLRARIEELERRLRELEIRRYGDPLPAFPPYQPPLVPDWTYRPWPPYRLPQIWC